MKLSYASKADITYLCAIENALFSIDDFRLNRRNFLYHISKKHIIIATINHTIVGYILYFVYKKSIRIYSLAVDEKFRGKKIATYLLLHVKVIADKLKKDCMTLEVKIDNHSAIHLYNKIGFKKVKNLKNYYVNDVDGLKMKWKINGAVGGI